MGFAPVSLTLVAFPFAGGGAYAYRPLEAFLPAGWKLVTYEPAGRGRRGHEPLARRIGDMVDDAVAALAPACAGAFALFGHSMGATLAFEAARRLRGQAGPVPRHLFVSGRPGPGAEPRRRRWDLPSPEFRQMLREMGGCPPEVLDEPELMEYFEPVLRADFEAIETWRACPAPPLAVPITAFIGEADEVTPAQAGLWQRETGGGFALHSFPGDHFFLFQHAARLTALMAAAVAG